MSDTHAELELKEDQSLPGFGTIFRAESRKWWGTQRWWMQILIWLVMVNGLVMMADFWSKESREDIVSGGVEFFFLIILIIPVVGLSIMMQGIIVGDKQSGTAAWILSKPVSRNAFLLAKFLANLIPALLIIIVLQSGVAYLQISAAAGGIFPIIPFLGKVGIAMLHLLFHLALILMLGTLFQVRGPVAGIPIAVLFGLLLLDELFPSGLMDLTPGAFIAIASGNPASLSTVTMLAIPAWVIFFVLVSLWRFDKEEF
jgi:ABC-2 type transport system permease protein